MQFPGCLIAVDVDHQFLATEQIEHRFGLGVVVTEAVGERFYGIVGTGDEPAATDVAGVGNHWAMVDQVVVESTIFTESTGQHTTAHHFVGYHNVDHRVDVIALEEELGLYRVAGKAVEHKAEVPVVFVESMLDDLFYDFITDELALADDTLDQGGEAWCGSGCASERSHRR